MSRSDCSGCVMAFTAACQCHIMVQYCCGSGSTSYLENASYFDRKPMKGS